MAGTVPTSGATTEPLVITVTTATPGATALQIQGFTWSLVTPVAGGICPAGLVVTGMTVDTCLSFATGGANDQVLKINATSAIPAGTTVSITTPAGFWSAGSNATFAIASTFFDGTRDQLVDDAILNLDTPAPPPDPNPAPAPAPAPAADPSLAQTGNAALTATAVGGVLTFVLGSVMLALVRRNRTT
jgi:hypothetical protein